MSRLLNSQDGEDLCLSNADHFNEEIMHRKRLIPSLHQTLQSRVHRVGTLKGLPRLFLLKRAFCLYWGVIIFLFIYLKWYYPLYLTRTAIRSTVQDFSTDWCRMRNARIDWKRIREPCEGNTVYEQHLPGWGEENRTNGRYSFVESVDIRPAGEFSRITLQSLTAYGDPKAVGGDYWRVFISGPTGFAPTVFDNGNGFYEILFLVLHPGNYCVSAVLDHSICEGMKDPPDYWFISGNIHGSNQSPGILKGKQVYLMQPLMGGEPLCFNVPASHGPMIRDEFLSYGLGHPSHCGTGCKFLSDGFGYWMNDTWIAHAPEKLFERSPRNREGILWIYGDSLALRFYDSIHYTQLCSEIFRACNITYSWVYTMLEPVQVEKFKKNYRDFDPYRVLQEIRDVIHMPEMDEKSVIILNCGLHYVSALKFAVYRQLIDDIIATFKEKWKNEFGEEQLKFRGKLIWKTTTAIHRERFLYHDHPSPRFLTLQRIQLYNAYAIWAMCKAGFEVLDVFPMSYSYPGGTDGRFDRHDAVHFKNTVFKPAEQLLHEYFSPYEGKDNKKRLYNRLYHNKNYSL
ncbi:uncharacterized protein [Montipora capricornis]|uniref:uncharacterized protein n=1 Tax=Montipora capricornis TaxID=246305 RepID=UPI0035F18210